MCEHKILCFAAQTSIRDGMNARRSMCKGGSEENVGSRGGHKHGRDSVGDNPCLESLKNVCVFILIYAFIIMSSTN
jgi:hypothetical protein